MNFKSAAKKSDFTMRNTGASNLACQYRHFLKALVSYSETGQWNRWQKSKWNG
jgi:thermostable 8-oxoguanine DNA glycosylase